MILFQDQRVIGDFLMRKTALCRIAEAENARFTEIAVLLR